VSARLVLRAAAAAALIAAAVLLALLGWDVLRWSGQTERGAVALAAGSRDPAIWRPATTLPAGLSEALLGLGDDLAYDRALQRYVVIKRNGLIAKGRTLTIVEADRAFEQVEESGLPAPTRSLARTLHGVLLVAGASALGGGDAAFVAKVENEFRTAIRLDPANPTPKFDLERLLRVEGALQRAAGAPPPERSGRRGARGQGTGRGTSAGGGGY
jgi:hypothetical protein